MCRLGYGFGFRAYPHAGKQLSSSRRFCRGRAPLVHGRTTTTTTVTMTTMSPRTTSPTVADVRRRARQSTCHATPGSFELIAGTSLSPPSRPRIPSSPRASTPISSHSGLLVRFFSHPPLLRALARTALFLAPSCAWASIPASSSRLE